MPRLVDWSVAGLAVLFVLDRLLLYLESRGWINYRRRGLGRGAAQYHMLELHSVFEPGVQEVMEVKYAEEVEEDDAGGPPAQRPPSDLGKEGSGADPHKGQRDVPRPFVQRVERNGRS